MVNKGCHVITIGWIQPDDNRKSRTQKKNEAQALQKLGEQLVALPPEQFAGL